MREKDTIRTFIDKQNQDIRQVQIMIKQTQRAPENLERVQSKCQQVEQNLKNFKLKSRTTFQSLIDEEKTL